MRLLIRTTYPQVQIEYLWPQLEIEQKVSQIRIEKSGPRLEIEEKQCLRELGLGSYKDLGLQIRERSYEQVLLALKKMSAEGDEVLEQGGRFLERMIFSEIEQRKTEESVPEVNVKAAPQTRPKISFPCELKISWEEGGASITYRGGPPRITWNLGSVEVWVEKAEKRGG